MSGPEITLHKGDMLEVLDTLPAEHFDAVVTDPPYHLTSIVKRFGGKRAAPAKHGTDGAFVRASRGFMGQEWDGGDIAFRPETWAKVLRVMKPGAHLVAFNHSRTWHRMAAAIEDAGFEIRDSLAWLYGTGFPKSHDVAAGIDKLRDDSADVVRVTSWLADKAEAAGVTRADVDRALGTSDMGGWFLSRLQHRCALPKPEQWEALRALIGFGGEMDAEFARLAARKGEPGEAWRAAPVIGRHEKPAQAATWRATYTGRAVASAERPGERRAYNSPAAREWAGWGTALKPGFEPVVLARRPLRESSVARQVLATGTGALHIDAARIPAGDEALRWPANVVHDGSAGVLAAFPLDPCGRTTARVFYCAKADAADRRGSKHPTVKPQALMRWLVRLVARRGAVILDPFGGSGSTAWAAHAEGVACHLIERESEYQADIERGIAALSDAPAPAADALPGQMSLFDATEESDQ